MNIETLRLLVAKGLSADDILEVAETMDAPAGRSSGAERQARYRARKAGRDVTGDVTGDADGVTGDPALSLPPNENNLTPPPNPTRINTPRARGGVSSRLPTGWEPQPLTGDVGTAAENWPPGALDRELERFRDWAASASGPNAKKSDWQAAWRNWVRKADDEGRYGNGTVRRHCGTATRPTDAFSAVLQRQAGYRASDFG